MRLHGYVEGALLSDVEVATRLSIVTNNPCVYFCVT